MMDKLIAVMDAYFRTRPGYYDDVVAPPSRVGMRVIDLDYRPEELIRAILTALKEPSEATLRRGELALREGGAHLETWEAMLDEAMK